MTSEERILAILEKMDNRLGFMENRFESMDGRLVSLEEGQKTTFRLVDSLAVQMQKGFEKVDERLTNLENEARKTNIAIEHDIKPKIEALFDGYQLHSEKLERIEQEVSRQEEVILRRLK